MYKNNPKIKICGIKEISTAKLLIDLEVDFVGLNFIKNSTRYLNEKNAKQKSLIKRLLYFYQVAQWQI